MFKKRIIKICLVFFGISLFFVLPVFATSGTIDSTDKYAWGSKIGWINFSPTKGNVQVTDSAITGYAWNENYGWINLSPTKSGVLNDGSGTLSGYAWNANLGWINFSGVTIGVDGVFAGQGTGDNSGVINFSCDKCSVKTDWRPQSATPAVGGGGGLPINFGNLPAEPYYFTINNNVTSTIDGLINIEANCGPTAKFVWLGEDLDFVYNSQRVACPLAGSVITIPFNLSAGFGIKTIHAMFCTGSGYCSGKLSASINFLAEEITPEVIQPEVIEKLPVVKKVYPKKIEPTVSKPGILEKVKELASQAVEKLSSIKITDLPFASVISGSLEKIKLALPGFFNPRSIQSPTLDKIVSQQAPLALRGIWGYLPPAPVNHFVFAPLPKEFQALVNKFPEVKNTFHVAGVTKMSDVSKLVSVSLHLPGLQNTMASLVTDLPIKKIGDSSFLPLASLTPDLKKKIPSNIVFVRGKGELVDFAVTISLGETGKPVQKIEAIAGKALHLAVRPESSAKTVQGYIVFKERRTAQTVPNLKFSLTSLLGSWFFAEPALAVAVPIAVEERLVLNNFEYIDPDKDGIYTADIVAPVPVGEYEIITIIDYFDPVLGRKELRLITVVDPEGYVYEKIKNNELRISGAVVSLYRWSESRKTYDLWSAGDYSQENPQITGLRGSYSFLVPEGKYYLMAQAPGYRQFESEMFEVKEGGGVHLNLELKSAYWWVEVWDWKIALLVAVTLLLLYNFWQDRRRGRATKMKGS